MLRRRRPKTTSANRRWISGKQQKPLSDSSRQAQSCWRASRIRRPSRAGSIRPCGKRNVPCCLRRDYPTARGFATRFTRPDSTRDTDRKEHTSELQSPCNLVCRLLLEKKNTERRRDGGPL